ERGRWLPVCHAVLRGPRGTKGSSPRSQQGQPLQRCLSRPVRVPERFRGCCPFGARGYAETLPAGVISICDLTRRGGLGGKVSPRIGGVAGGVAPWVRSC